MLPQHQINIRN